MFFKKIITSLVKSVKDLINLLSISAKNKLQPFDEILFARHEVGHALVCHLLTKHHKVDNISIKRKRNSDGRIKIGFNTNIDNSILEELKEEKILIILGGAVGQNLQLIHNSKFVDLLYNINSFFRKIMLVHLIDTQGCDNDFNTINEELIDLSKDKEYINGKILYLIEEFRKNQDLKNLHFEITDYLLRHKQISRKKFNQLIKKYQNKQL